MTTPCQSHPSLSRNVGITNLITPGSQGHPSASSTSKTGNTPGTMNRPRTSPIQHHLGTLQCIRRRFEQTADRPLLSLPTWITAGLVWIAHNAIQRTAWAVYAKDLISERTVTATLIVTVSITAKSRLHGHSSPFALRLTLILNSAMTIMNAVHLLTAGSCLLRMP